MHLFHTTDCSGKAFAMNTATTSWMLSLGLALLVQPAVVAATTSINNDAGTSSKCIQTCHARGHCCGGVPAAGGQVVSECGQPSCAMGCLIGSVSTTYTQCTATCHKHSPQQNCSFTVGQYSFNTCEDCPASCGGVQPDCGGSDSVDGCVYVCGTETYCAEKLRARSHSHPHAHVYAPAYVIAL